jgi:hypothetical protein
MKQKAGYFALVLFAVVLCGCIRVRPQVSITENQEPTVAEIVPQEPLLPINERLDGTVWVVADDMFEDIPIGAMTVYTFGKNELITTNYRLDNSQKYSVDQYSITYAVPDPQTITYFNNRRYTVHYDGDDLIKTAHFNDDDWQVKNGEAKAGNISYTHILYPYNAKFRDMDITKTLVLEGTSWKQYGYKNGFILPSEYWKKEYANIERYWNNGIALIDNDFSDKSNMIFFSADTCTFGLDGPSFPYIITPRHIILLDKSWVRIGYVQENKLILPYTERIIFGYIKQ